MKIWRLEGLAVAALLGLGTLGMSAEGITEPDEILELADFPVLAGSYAEHGGPATQLSERMSREARVDLQSRGGERYQTDISIRGGIFEGTGLMVGGLALFDPQTGHYFSEIPLDPAFFSSARLLTGVDNGIYGFNSTAGSIDWHWAPLRSGGTAYVVGGTDSLIGGGLRTAGRLGEGLGYEVAVMHEEGDGSVEYGDFDLTRLSGRVEYQLGAGRLRIFGGYLQKYYGWPGMYTGYDLHETDDYTVSLLGWQWESGNLAGGGQHRIGGYWRLLDDDYEYLREQPNHFFEHKTEVLSLQGDGVIPVRELEILYRWAVVHDELIRSTSLVNGDFNERDYGEAAVLARKSWETPWGQWSAYGGAGIDTTDQESTVGLPQAGVELGGLGEGFSWSGYLEYSETSQVPGYTALKSPPSGLFGGNPYLGRETADTLEAGFLVSRDSISAKLVVFQRDDRDLVDWVYSSEAPNARLAAPVDLTVRGVEGWLRWEGRATAVELGYAWLDKDADYGSSTVDASFYALNYARHRLLLTLERRLAENIFLRLEGEYRKHPDNALRESGNEALYLNVAASWNNIFGEGWTLLVRGENLGKDSFQSLPGTPGRGREGSVTVSYDW